MIRIVLSLLMIIFSVNAYAQSVVVLSTGSNYLGQSKVTIQSQIDNTVVAIKAKQPNAQIIMVIPFKSMSEYIGVINGINVYGGGGTTTIPSDAATAVASKYSIPTVTFSNSYDNIHPSDYNAVIQQIKGITNVPSAKWQVVGDSIALAIASNAGASTQYAMNSKTPQYILDNFVSLLSQSFASNSKISLFVFGNSGNKGVTFGTGLGIRHDVTPTHIIGLSFGFEQKSELNPQIIFVGLNYTYNF
jgi:hypothetical protein